jgi:hypothetical protein
MKRNIAMKTLNKNEIQSVSGSEDEALLEPHYYSDPFVPPALRNPTDPLVPVPIRRQPVSQNPLS